MCFGRGDVVSDKEHLVIYPVINKENRNSRKVLHECVSPYLTHTYNMVIHLVQGGVLAILFLVLIENPLTTLIYFKILPVFLLICLLWHSYLVHDQYIAQRARIIDTLAPLALGLFECLLILSIPKSVFEYALFFTIIPFIGIFAYICPYTAYRDPDTLELYKEHFKEQGEDFAVTLHSELKRFDKYAVFMMTIVFFIFCTITAFIYYFNISEDFKTYFATISFTLIIIFLLYTNMDYFLNHSKKLQKFGYRW